jgi:HSP20 family protein
MLMRTDSLRDFDRLAQQATGANQGTPSRSTAMPMDAYREGDPFTVFFDLPGVDPAEINLNVERNVLTVRAERSPAAVGEGVEMQIFEHPTGLFSRQLFLSETLSTERTEVDYVAGILVLRIPVPEGPSRGGSPSAARTVNTPASRALLQTASEQ